LFETCDLLISSFGFFLQGFELVIHGLNEPPVFLLMDFHIRILLFVNDLLKLLKELAILSLEMSLVFVESPNVLLHRPPVSLEQVVLIHQRLVFGLCLNLVSEGTLCGLVSLLVVLDLVLFLLDLDCQLRVLLNCLFELILKFGK
jgi:hypothetical protein